MRAAGLQEGEGKGHCTQGGDTVWFNPRCLLGAAVERNDCKCFLILSTGGSAQALWQSPVSITKPERKTVLITCHVSISNFDKVFIHWYRKRPGEAPRRIAYMATRLFLENESDKGKFSIEKDIAKSECTLTANAMWAVKCLRFLYC
ncbi:hypothetical protein CIB84_014945 [Bambusicola thoracicus]|uniref:Immunoglobulin V-set domain-containing protein n=1 Tax=Bambusicola thoracicus TaxID=9083 RepID=A0A2P4SB14_BAMTH|nr:hypothetical protein CIB84_014945 [Bambusicola thoracicus]